MDHKTDPEQLASLLEAAQAALLELRQEVAILRDELRDAYNQASYTAAR